LRGFPSASPPFHHHHHHHQITKLSHSINPLFNTLLDASIISKQQQQQHIKRWQHVQHCKASTTQQLCHCFSITDHWAKQHCMPEATTPPHKQRIKRQTKPTLQFHKHHSVNASKLTVSFNKTCVVLKTTITA
jgi:hypothetical protein